MSPNLLLKKFDISEIWPDPIEYTTDDIDESDDADVEAFEAQCAAVEAFLLLVSANHVEVDCVPQIMAPRREGGE